MMPSARTLKHLRDKGHTAAVVERYNSFAKVRNDLFGFIDIICLRYGAIVGIQATSGTNHSHRIEKALANPILREWLNAQGAFEVISWRKGGPRGKAKKWIMRRTIFSIPMHASLDGTQIIQTSETNDA